MKNTQVIGLKARLEEKIRALEKERTMLLEEIVHLKEVVVLNEKAKDLEDEVNRLKMEVKALREKIPLKLLRELMEITPSELTENHEEENSEECYGCQQEEELF